MSPYCTPIERPELSRVEVKELESVSDETYNKLYLNERRLIEWGNVNYEIINLICEGEE